MSSNIPWSLATQITLHKTRWNVKRRIITIQVVAMISKGVIGMIKTLGNMNRQAYGVANAALNSTTGFQYFDGIWMAHYGKCKAWSDTSYSYIIVFHDTALLDGSKNSLFSTHTFHHHQSSTLSSNFNGNGTSACVLKNAASVPREVDSNNDHINFFKSKATQVLHTSQTSTTDADFKSSPWWCSCWRTRVKLVEHGIFGCCVPWLKLRTLFFVSFWFHWYLSMYLCVVLAPSFPFELKSLMKYQQYSSFYHHWSYKYNQPTIQLPTWQFL